MLYRKFLDPSYDDWQIMIVEEEANDLDVERLVVAFSIWMCHIFTREYRARRTWIHSCIFCAL